MIRYENECVQCGLPCFLSCPHQRVPHYYCDACGAEDVLYPYDGEELCLDCIFDSLPKAETEYCACCGEEGEIKWLDGEQMCKSCVEDKLQEGGCYGEF